MIKFRAKIALKTAMAEMKRAQMTSRKYGCVAPRVKPCPCPSGSKELNIQANFYINTF